MATKLFIIGNGFDIWSGLNTSFSCFRDYYYSNQRRIIKELYLPIYNNVQGHLISDLELLFGDPYDRFLLDDFFWNDFETFLCGLSYARTEPLFPDTSDGILNMAKSLDNAKRLLQKSFQEWICSLEIPSTLKRYKFDNDCYFINFNYTETLTKMYGVNPNNVFYIHGQRMNPKSIIFGHTMHPHKAPEYLIKIGEARLFLIAKYRYLFDKHAIYNFQRLIMYFDLASIDFHQIEDVYFLGHSMNLADCFYYYLISNFMLNDDSKTNLHVVSQEDIYSYQKYVDNYEFIYDEIIARDRRLSKKETEYLNMKAFEDAGLIGDTYDDTAEQIKDELKGLYHFGKKDTDEVERRCYPKWHVSYYKEEEHDIFLKNLHELGWSNHRIELSNSIDEILLPFSLTTPID